MVLTFPPQLPRLPLPPPPPEPQPREESQGRGEGDGAGELNDRFPFGSANMSGGDSSSGDVPPKLRLLQPPPLVKLLTEAERT